MTSSLIFDLVARDKGFDSTMDGSAKAAERLAKQLQDAGRRSGQGFAVAARQIGATLEQIERDAWESGNATDDAFKKAVRGMRSDFEKLREAGRITGASLESDLGGALRDMKEQVDQFARQASAKTKAAGEDISDSFGDSFGGIGDMLGDAFGGGIGKAGLLGAGAAVGAVLVKGIQQSFEEVRVGGLIAAQTGQATEAAGRLGTLAGDIYAGNFGESIEQVGESLTALFQNEVVDTSASEDAIKHLSEQVLTVSQTTTEGVSAITRSAQQLVLTGLAGSFTQALDMIQQATEQGLNVSGELLDTIDEYSVQFERMGLNGAEAFGLLEQATDAGARNIDVAADAIKEFAIRAQDGTEMTARGFRTLGLDAMDSMAAIAAGGGPAQEVLRQVLNRLQEMPPSVQRTTAAVDLFGTKAEDLGDSLYAMDLDTAADALGDFNGAVEQAGKTTAETTPALDKFGRAIGDAAASAGGFFVAAADTMIQGLGEMTGLIDENADASADASGATDEWGSEMWGANEAATTLIQTMDELIAQQSGYASSFVNSAEAQIDYNQALAEATELSKNFSGGLDATKSGFDLTSEAGQNAQGVIDDVVTAGWNMVAMMSADGASAEQLNAVIAQSNTKLYELLTAMGVNAGAARVLADRMFGIPDVDPTVTLVDNASPKIADITAKLNRLDGKWVNTYVNTIFKQTGTAPAGSPAGGGGLLGDSSGRARGGPVKRGEEYIVGEEGYELFVPDTNGTIIPHDALLSSAGALRPASWADPAGGAGAVSRVDVSVGLAASAGGDAGVGQWIQGLVRRGILKLTVDSSGRVQAG